MAGEKVKKKRGWAIGPKGLGSSLQSQVLVNIRGKDHEIAHFPKMGTDKLFSNTFCSVDLGRHCGPFWPDGTGGLL